MTSPVNPIAYTELHTGDPGRARAFYGELFGWKSEEEQTPNGPYTTFRDLLLGLTPNREGVPTTWVPYVAVADVSSATKRARELGGQILRDSIAIAEGTFSVVRDPTGAVFGIWQPKK